MCLVVMLLFGGITPSCKQETNVEIRQPLWVLSLPENNIYQSLKGTDGLVYCLTGNDSFRQAIIYAVDGQTGVVKWKKEVESKSLSQTNFTFEANDGKVYYRTQTGILQALDAQTGIETWQVEKAQLVLHISDGKVHLYDDKGEYVILNAANGEVIERTGIIGSFPSQLVIVNNRRYLFNSKQLLIIDASTGKRLWAHQPQGNFPLGFSVADGVLYIVEPDYAALKELTKPYRSDILTAYNAETGQKLWQIYHSGDSPIVENGVAFLGGDDKDGSGTVSRLNPKTGEMLGVIKSEKLKFDSKFALTVSAENVYAKNFQDHFSRPDLVKFLYGDEKATSLDYQLVSFNTSSGMIKWETQFLWGEPMTKPFIANGCVYFGIRSANLVPATKLFAYSIN